MTTKFTIYLLLLTLFSLPLHAAPESPWFIRAITGLSQMSDIDATTSGIGSIDGSSEISLDTGFFAGLGVGYHYSENLAVEVSWEYRTNDSQVVLADDSQFQEGNYASNLFFLNALYFPAPNNPWKPYIGAGISWAQEIDIDLEENGVEQSFSSDGETGVQIFGGVNYPVNESFSVNGEVRYGSITGLDLQGENGPESFNDMDYETLSLQIGLSYRF